jgi:hypothetical protein
VEGHLILAQKIKNDKSSQDLQFTWQWLVGTILSIQSGLLINVLSNNLINLFAMCPCLLPGD